MGMVNRGIALGLVALLAFTGACAPLAVHPPYEEAEKGWTIEPGRVVTRDGAEVRGWVVAVDESGFVIGETRVKRDDIAEMAMERENPAGVALGGVVFGAFALGGLFVLTWLTLPDHGEPRPKSASN